jgi:hypothetical protein
MLSPIRLGDRDRATSRRKLRRDASIPSDVGKQQNPSVLVEVEDPVRTTPGRARDRRVQDSKVSRLAIPSGVAEAWDVQRGRTTGYQEVARSDRG